MNQMSKTKTNTKTSQPYAEFIRSIYVCMPIKRSNLQIWFEYELSLHVSTCIPLFYVLKIPFSCNANE